MDDKEVVLNTRQADSARERILKMYDEGMAKMAKDALTHKAGDYEIDVDFAVNFRLIKPGNESDNTEKPVMPRYKSGLAR